MGLLHPFHFLSLTIGHGFSTQNLKSLWGLSVLEHLVLGFVVNLLEVALNPVDDLGTGVVRAVMHQFAVFVFREVKLLLLPVHGISFRRGVLLYPV